MKKILKTLVVLSMVGLLGQAAALAQTGNGSFEAANRDNSNPANLNAPVYVDSVTLNAGLPDLTVGTGSSSGQLAPRDTIVQVYWALGVVGSVGSLQLLNNFSNTLTLFSSPNGGFFGGTTAIFSAANAGSQIAPGTQVSVAFKATNAGLNKEGFSEIFQITLVDAGNASQPLPPAIAPWAITASTIPEPSTVALGLIGGLALIFRLRRRD